MGEFEECGSCASAFSAEAGVSGGALLLVKLKGAFMWIICAPGMGNPKLSIGNSDFSGDGQRFVSEGHS